MLLQCGPHHLLDGTDVLVEFDHQGVVVHALHVGYDGVVPLLGQGDQVVETVNPGMDGWTEGGLERQGVSRGMEGQKDGGRVREAGGGMFNILGNMF